MINHKTAIIIGAGPAGLTAAYQLLKQTGIRPVVLEEESFAGGISRTVQYRGNRMDIGGHRFFTKNGEVRKIWEELLPPQGFPAKDDLLLNRPVPLVPGGPDPETCDRVMLNRRRVSRIFYSDAFFDYPVTLKWSAVSGMGIGNTLRAGFGYLAALLRKRPEKSLEDFYINRFGGPLYRMFFEDYTEKIWGKHPSELSPDWGAQRVKGLSLLKAVRNFLFPGKVKETSLIESFRYPKYGPGQLWEAMAEEITRMGGTILYGHRVVSVRTENHCVKEVVCVRGGKEISFSGDFFFSSMPVKDLIGGMDGVPAPVRRIAENLPYRDFITVGLKLKKLKIKNRTGAKTLGNIVPDCWIYIQDRNVKIGRLQIFNNWSPYLVEDPEKTVWIGLEYFCREGDAMWNQSDAEFIKFAVSDLSKTGIADPADVLDSTVVRVKKAYPAYFGAYSEFETVRTYLDSFPNLYCIGRNGQHRYNNMDHSMLTAMKAAEALRTGSGKSEVWNVNAEKDYHETTSQASSQNR